MRPEIESHIPREQTFIPGTAPPPEDPQRTPDLDAVVYAWLTAQSDQRHAADVTKIKHAAMLERLAEAGCETYPYVDEKSGRKRYVVVDRTPKAKKKAAAGGGKSKKAKRSKRFAADHDDDLKDANGKAADKAQKRIDDDANRVESRRVPRDSVEEQIDPFAATRGALEADHGHG